LIARKALAATRRRKLPRNLLRFASGGKLAIFENEDDLLALLLQTS
jgi:hypothetical protein